jgi:hypothetical protein
MNRTGVLGFVVLLIGLGCAAAERPHFSATVGQFEAGAAFTDFVFAHQKEIVRLTVAMEEEDFDGSLPDGIDEADGADEAGFFVLWEACEGLPKGAAPSTEYCTGTEINIDANGVDPADSGLSHARGTYRLEGYFAVQGCDGPHQGLMGCTLKALKIEEAL